MPIILEAASGVFIEAESRQVWARACNGTLLGPATDIPADSGARRLVVRAGFLIDEDEPGHPDPRTWGERGWDALKAGVRSMLSRGGSRLLLRPAFSDVLSDTPSCLRFLRSREEWGGDGAERLALLLDPIAMLAPSMIPVAEDHVARILELVASQPGVEGVVAANVDMRGDSPLPAPLHRGVIDPARLAHLFRTLVPPAVPLVLAEREIDAQRHALAIE